ncbi:unnamed protein product [Mycena citricolor]|uniref:Uncharacterized protein n=1 Tax=Mycena citricolor TaxID=2018698 RepID=A0AAD2HEA1_9AGAR|nr:unnamed protein product [Mycena citricolor]CAK5272537.1 unnamed protein product [Mycena citricolor]
MPSDDTSSTSDSELSLSKLSLHSNGSQSELDWDRSISVEGSMPPSPGGSKPHITPRNSILFPANGDDDQDATPGRGKPGKRSLSELMRLHAEKGTDCTFSPEEAARVADVLRDWINAGSSPYEGEDDFFSRDDLDVPYKGNPASAIEGRPRGRSDLGGTLSRPTSAAGSVKS